MATEINTRILLASRPIGEPTADNFRFEQSPIPRPEVGEVLLRTLYLSLDPYMRGRMSDAKSYAAPVEVGQLMEGGTVCEVLTSRHPGFHPGDIVRAYSGWQSHAVVKGDALTRIDPALAPVSTALGILGMPGMTAYTGLLTIGQPKPGETVVVAAATGPVGSLVGQIARLKGCRVIGIAGGSEKCAYAVSTYGFDACLDHRRADFAQALASACADGIDVYFENVGGAVFEAVLPLLNPFARLPVCGLISSYNATEAPTGINQLPGFMGAVLRKRLLVRGFIVWDFAEQQQQFEQEVSHWLKTGQVAYREDIVDGLENAPEAFIGLLKGKNFGKLLIRVAPDPTRHC